MVHHRNWRDYSGVKYYIQKKPTLLRCRLFCYDRPPDWCVLNQEGKSERVEAVEQHLSLGSQKMAYKNLFYELLKQELNLEQTISSDAPYDVEVTGYQEEKAIQICAVLLNEHEKARKVEDFHVSVKCNERPSAVE